MDDLVYHYHYDPQPERPWFEPGATKGYFVLWSGEPGDALVAGAVVIADEDGQLIREATSAFTETTVVAD